MCVFSRTIPTLLLIPAVSRKLFCSVRHLRSLIRRPADVSYRHNALGGNSRSGVHTAGTHYPPSSQPRRLKTHLFSGLNLKAPARPYPWTLRHCTHCSSYIRGLLYRRSSGVGFLSVCLSATIVSHAKRLNLSRCRLECGLEWAQRTVCGSMVDNLPRLRLGEEKKEEEQTTGQKHIGPHLLRRTAIN